MCKGTVNHEEIYFIQKENIPKETLKQLNERWINNHGGIPVDKCIGKEVEHLIKNEVVTVWSCCGHSRWNSGAMARLSDKDKIESLGYETRVFENRLLQFNLKTGTQLGGR